MIAIIILYAKLETPSQDRASNNDLGPTFCIFCPLRLDFAAQHHSAIQRLHVDVHNTARHHVSKMVGITLSLSCRVDGFNAMGLHRSVQIRHDGGALCAAFVFPL